MTRSILTDVVLFARQLVDGYSTGHLLFSYRAEKIKYEYSKQDIWVYKEQIRDKSRNQRHPVQASPAGSIHLTLVSGSNHNILGGLPGNRLSTIARHLIRSVIG